GMMRGALALLLGMEPDLAVVGQVSTGDQIVPTALEVRPDVAVLDIEMPNRSGLDAAAELHAELPACKILIVTTFGRPGYLRRAMEAGASGFLVKDGPVEDLAGAIRRVLAGDRVVDPELATAALSAGPNPLTGRGPNPRPGRGAGRAGGARGRLHHRRHRGTPAPVGEHAPQLPAGRDRQPRGAQPHGGRTGPPPQRLALGRV